ncbi:MAG TPA: PAS domain S-box protein [Planctomycetota bacterium]|jgi:hypothetical protein
MEQFSAEHRTLQSAVRRAVILPVLLVVVFAGVMAAMVVHLLDQAEWVDHTFQVIATIRQYRKMASDAETGVRGYQIDRSSEFLEPYENANATMGPVYDQLLQLVLDNPRQTQKAKEVHDAYQRWADFARDLVARQKQGEPLDQIRSHQSNIAGKNLMDAFREVSDDFLQTETDLRNQRQHTVERTARVTLGFGVGLMLLLGGILAFYVRSQMKSAGSIYAVALDRTKQSEEQLRQERAWLTVTLSSIGDAVIATDRESRVALLNPVAEQLTGWTADQAIGQPLEDVFNIVNEETRQPAVNPVARVLREGHVVGLANHTALINKDGREFPIEDSAAPIRSADGNVLGVVMVFHDVTEKRRAAEELAALAKFPGENPNPVLRVKQDGTILYANAASQPVLEEWKSAVGDPAPALWREAIARAFSTSTSTELDVTCGARVFSLSIAPVPEAGYLNLYARDVTERRRAEEALRESEERFRLLVAGVKDYAIFMVDPEGLVASWNEGAQRIKGWTADEIVGQPISRFYTEEAVAAGHPQRELEAAAAQGRHEEEGWRVRKDGSRFFASVSINALHDDAGKLCGFAKITRDITERKQAAEALRQSAARLAGVVDSAMDAIISVDDNQRIVMFNAAAEKMFRCPAAQAMGQPLDRFIPERARNAHREHIQRFGKTGETARQMGRLGTVSGLRSDGEEFPIEASISHIAINGQKLFTVILRDITERKQAEDTLRNSEARLSLAYKGARIGAFEWNVQTGVNVWTPELEAMYGLAPGEFGKSQPAWEQLVHPEDRAAAVGLVNRTFETGEPVDGEWRVVWRDGSVHWLAGRFQTFKDAAGKPLRLSGVNMDITERKQAEEAVREEARRKDEFMAMLGHELRNPLAPIRNAAHVLGRIQGRDKILESMREIITRQVTHMTRLVDDLLDVSRINRGKVILKTELLDLASLVRTATEDQRPLLEASGLTLEVRVPADRVWVNGDSARLVQIIGNLVNNANKFTDRGGSVLVELGVKRELAVIIVSDTGIGIETEMVGNVFQPFRQSERARHRDRLGGLGLGLALVKGLTELHGGSVGACSGGPGKGSQFVVRLPMVKAPVSVTAAEAPAPAARALRVLIVEDNLDAAATLRLLLELAGHHVAETHTAQEGLAGATQFRPEVVLCDIGLPNGMNGYDFARAARKDGDLKHVYLVAMTGFGQDEDKRRALDAGFDMHLTKPIDPEALERLLADVPSHD